MNNDRWILVMNSSPVSQEESFFGSYVLLGQYHFSHYPTSCVSPRIGVSYYVVELDITGFLRLRLFIILEDLVV